MARAIWTGAINFGLVSIPVKLFTAVRRSELRFHLLHEKDMGTIHNERVCNVCEKKLQWGDLVRGHEIERGTFVPVSEEELRKASVEATQSVDIVEFVAMEEIDPILFDTPYYLVPEKRGRHAYALLREALEKSGRIGIARVVIRTREHLAALKPSGDALVLELMHWADEVIPQTSLELPAAASGIPGAEMKAAMMLIDSMTTEFDATEFHDRYREQVLELIKARAEGKKLPVHKPKAKKGRLIDLTALLQKSLNAAKPSTAKARPSPRKAVKRKAAA